MHTLLILFSLGLALGGSLFCLALLRMVRSTHSRRVLQGVGLFLPVLVLVLLAVVMAHFLSQICFMTAPGLDVGIAQGISVLGAIGIVAAILMNMMRALLLPMHLRRHTWQGPEWLQSRVACLSADTGLRCAPSLRVAADPRPWALAAGLFKPHVVVSSGLVGLLDREELEAVVCHELLHVRRGDLWWAALGGVLRDLTWFLPSTRRLFRLMLTEQEMACDDNVLGEGRRLALASALARVWQAGLSTEPAQRPLGALSFFSHPKAAHFEARVHRLLDYPGASARPSPLRALLAAVMLLGLFLPAQIGATLLAMDQMGCGMQGLMTSMMR